MNINSKAYWQMNLATILWGLTAILGKIISLDEIALVWYRVGISSAMLIIFTNTWKHLKQLKKNEIVALSILGILLTLHWIAWYGSIKYANASIAVSCIACVSFFVAILEPLVNRTPYIKSEILISILVIPGVWLINQSIDISYKKGFAIGILAAFLAALYAIGNKKYTQQISIKSITFIQLFSGWIFLSLLLPVLIKYTNIQLHITNAADIGWLLVLCTLCTILPYYLYFNALKISNAFTTSLINNLEPVYGILLAALILGESKELNLNFYLGVCVILAAVFIHAFYTNKISKRTKKNDII